MRPEPNVGTKTDSAAPKAFEILLDTAAAAVPDLEAIAIDNWEVVGVAGFGGPLMTWTRLGRHFFANTVDKDHQSPTICFYAPCDLKNSDIPKLPSQR
ncbi:hypothetical protein DL767_005326 [Monosporascus sp. MG133]|nr:hypothetical protein DL767_005326 [Monosporascus sp. MG133]